MLVKEDRSAGRYAGLGWWRAHPVNWANDPVYSGPSRNDALDIAVWMAQRTGRDMQVEGCVADLRVVAIVSPYRHNRYQQSDQEEEED